MKDGFRLYDTHAHLGAAKHSGRVHDTDLLLRAMDKAGVDRALLIPFPVVEDMRREHDLIGAAIRTHGDRFTGAACIDPFLSADEFRGELLRCVEVLGLRALKLQPQYQPLNPLSGRAESFFGMAAEFRLPVVAHTGTGVPFSLPSLFIAPARKFPDLTIVLGHSGGSVYMLESIVAASVCPNRAIESHAASCAGDSPTYTGFAADGRRRPAGIAGDGIVQDPLIGYRPGCQGGHSLEYGAASV
jgi:uncharacterized protein